MTAKTATTATTATRWLATLAALALCAAALLSAPAMAIEVVQGLTAEQEARYRLLAEELRCLVCQNQSLMDSNADLATDMRAVVRRMIKDGAADEEIIQFMTDRYGDFVLYRPPLTPATALLWALPFSVLLLGVIVLAMRRQKQHNAAALTEQQRQQAQRLLE